MTDEDQLAEYAAKINEAVTEHKERFQSSLEYAVKAGGYLTLAKKIVKQSGGNFLDWLKTNTKLKERTAQYYMKLGRNSGLIKSARLAEMTMAAAEQLIDGAEGKKKGAGGAKAARRSAEELYEQARKAIRRVSQEESEMFKFFDWLSSREKAFQKWVNKHDPR